MNKLLITEIEKIKEMMGVQILSEGIISSILEAVLHNITSIDKQIVKDFFGGVISAENRNELKVFLSSSEGKTLIQNLKTKSIDKTIGKNDRILAKKELNKLESLAKEAIDLPYGPIGGGVPPKTVGKQTTEQVLSNLRKYYPEFVLFETKINNLFPNVSENIKNSILVDFKNHMWKTTKELNNEIRSASNLQLLSKMGVVGKIIKGAIDNKKIVLGGTTLIFALILIYKWGKFAVDASDEGISKLKKFFNMESDESPTEDEFKNWVSIEYPAVNPDSLTIEIKGQYVKATKNGQVLIFKKISTGKYVRTK